MSNANMFRDVISKMMDAVTLDNKGNLKVLDENVMEEAEGLLNQMVVETARDWWAQLESAEGSLADMSDEISFSELNADPSHVGTPALDLSGDEAPEEAGLEGMLESDDFDLRSIFEGLDDDEDEDVKEEDEMDESYHMEDGEEFGPEDGDDDFDDLMRGDDDAGLGDDGPMGDDMDMMGDEEGDMDMIGGDDEMDMGDDDLGGEDDFDFDFLDAEEDDMDEMNHLDHMHESDDDDEDEDKDEDDD